MVLISFYFFLFRCSLSIHHHHQPHPCYVRERFSVQPAKKNYSALYITPPEYLVPCWFFPKRHREPGTFWFWGLHHLSSRKSAALQRKRRMMETESQESSNPSPVPSAQALTVRLLMLGKVGWSFSSCLPSWFLKTILSETSNANDQLFYFENNGIFDSKNLYEVFVLYSILKYSPRIISFIEDGFIGQKDSLQLYTDGFRILMILFPKKQSEKPPETSNTFFSCSLMPILKCLSKQLSINSDPILEPYGVDNLPWRLFLIRATVSKWPIYP